MTETKPAAEQRDVPIYEVTWRRPRDEVVTEYIATEHIWERNGWWELRRGGKLLLSLPAHRILAIRNVSALGPPPLPPTNEADAGVSAPDAPDPQAPCEPYYCPTSASVECCPAHSGWDTCCDAPEKHSRKVTWAGVDELVRAELAASAWRQSGKAALAERASRAEPDHQDGDGP